VKGGKIEAHRYSKFESSVSVSPFIIEILQVRRAFGAPLVYASNLPRAENQYQFHPPCFHLNQIRVLAIDVAQPPNGCIELAR